MTKLYFITFGNEKYYNSLQRIKKEVENFNIFDEIIIKNDKDLKDDIEFWNKHSDFIKKYNIGYGYWIWKPYINLKLMEKIDNDDIIVYADSGCTFNVEGKNRLLEYIELVKKNDILSFELKHSEKKYTKKDVFEYFNYQNNDDINIINATSFIYKKCNTNYNIFKLWYDTCCIYHLLNDEKSISKNYDEFIEHRHDQSVFSLLMKNYGFERIGYEIEEQQRVPIYASRNCGK